MNVDKIGFATLDLLEINMFSGEGKLLKYGASPTYIKPLVTGDFQFVQSASDGMFN